MQFIYFIVSLLFGLSCSTTKTLQNKVDIKTLVQQSPVFSDIFTGFVLHDPLTKKDLINIDGHKYYTPASNTKLLTLFTSINVLKDSIPVLKYEKRKDSLFFSGTANPMTLNPFFTNDNKVLIDFLRDGSHQLFYCPIGFEDKPFGPGWAWDDHLYYFQTEKTPLPLFGSLIHMEDRQVFPSFFQDSVSFMAGHRNYLRGTDDNQFEITHETNNFIRDMPFHYSKELTRNLLTHHIHKVVANCPDGFTYKSPRVLNQKTTDSLYVVFMQQSDNFIGEQLMLMNSFKLFDTMNVKRSIEWAQKELLHDMPDSLRWVDGSGLSRYNLFTPSSVVLVLDKILDEMGLERIKKIFSAGGQDRTTNGWYDAEMSYIYAKTGTLSNKHCLSGYIISRNNRLLIFSFMNNNYLGNLEDVKDEMQKVLYEIYLKY